ncbi:MAG TPA: SDR family oxidoreductase [Paracoccus sp.]|nr:SDR family oxidoreductase [Paracoccus sp. (in: a-proteobacteria)]
MTMQRSSAALITGGESGINAAPHAIRINSVGSGYVNTPMQRGRIDDACHRELAGMHLLKRFAEADEIAAQVVWLLSDDASFATGSHYPIDGGYTTI